MAWETCRRGARRIAALPLQSPFYPLFPPFPLILEYLFILDCGRTRGGEMEWTATAGWAGAWPGLACRSHQVNRRQHGSPCQRAPRGGAGRAVSPNTYVGTRYVCDAAVRMSARTGGLEASINTNLLETTPSWRGRRKEGVASDDAAAGPGLVSIAEGRTQFAFRSRNAKRASL